MYAFKTLTIKGVEGVWERYLQAGHTGGYSSPEGSLSQEAVEEFAKKMKTMAEMFLGLFCTGFEGQNSQEILGPI